MAVLPPDPSEHSGAQPLPRAFGMSEAEKRALRRAVAALLVLSLVRWVAATVAEPPAGPDGDALPGLLESSAAALDEAGRRAAPLQPGERLDPNRASAEELDRLPGIGAATADAIVRERESGGPFFAPSDLVRVPGLGPASVTRLALHLDLDAPPPASRPQRPSRRSRVDLNRASPEDLVALPGIGPALAARIEAARKKRPFTAIEDLLGVPGIGPATLERLRPMARVGRGN